MTAARVRFRGGRRRGGDVFGRIRRAGGRGCCADVSSAEQPVRRGVARCRHAQRRVHSRAIHASRSSSGSTSRHRSLCTSKPAAPATLPRLRRRSGVSSRRRSSTRSTSAAAPGSSPQPLSSADARPPPPPPHVGRSRCVSGGAHRLSYRQFAATRPADKRRRPAHAQLERRGDPTRRERRPAVVVVPVCAWRRQATACGARTLHFVLPYRIGAGRLW